MGKISTFGFLNCVGTTYNKCVESIANPSSPEGQNWALAERYDALGVTAQRIVDELHRLQETPTSDAEIGFLVKTLEDVEDEMEKAMRALQEFNGTRH